MALCGFKIANEITQLTFNLGQVFNECFHPQYSALIHAAIEAINSPPNETGAPIQIRFDSAEFLCNLSIHIPQLFTDPETLSLIFSSLPSSFVIATVPLFRSLHNLMLICLRINYQFLSPEDVTQETENAHSFLPFLLQYGIRSLNSTYNDPQYMFVVLQFWHDIAIFEQQIAIHLDSKIEVGVSSLLKEREDKLNRGSRYIGKSYQQNEKEKVFNEIRKEVETKEKSHFPSLNICKTFSTIIMPILFNFLRFIDETQTDIENLECDSISKFASLTFRKFVQVAPEEAIAFFKETFIPLSQAESWVFQNTAIMLLIIMSASHNPEIEQLIQESLISEEVNAKALLFKWASSESHPFLRETALFALGDLCHKIPTIVLNGIFEFDIIIPFINSIIEEFSQTNYPNPFILTRALQILYRFEIRWKETIYQNPLLKYIDAILGVLKGAIEVSIKIHYPLGIKTSFECLTGYVRSIPLDTAIYPTFLQLLSSDFQALNSEINILDEFAITYYSALVSNITAIVLKISKIISYPTQDINQYYGSIIPLLRFPELHTDVLLVLGAMIKWSGGSANLPPEIGQSSLEIASSALNSQSPEVMKSSCLLIADLFEA